MFEESKSERAHPTHSHLGELLSFESVQDEYFAHFTEDERFQALLQNEPEYIKAKALGVSTELINTSLGELFPPNAIDALVVRFDNGTSEAMDIPAFSFRAEGRMIHDLPNLDVDIVIASDLRDDAATIITSIDGSADEFSVIKEGRDELFSRRIDTKELYLLIGALAGYDKSHLHSVINLANESGYCRPEDYRQLIPQLWKEIGEKNGSLEVSQLLTNAPTDDSDIADGQEVISILYEKNETLKESTERVTLACTKHYLELDVEDIHELSVQNTSIRSSDTIDELTAERIIASGVKAKKFKSIEAIRRHDGRITHLDVSDSNVRTEFIDWFDTLVAS